MKTTAGTAKDFVPAGTLTVRWAGRQRRPMRGRRVTPDTGSGS